MRRGSEEVVWERVSYRMREAKACMGRGGTRRPDSPSRSKLSISPCFISADILILRFPFRAD